MTSDSRTITLNIAAIADAGYPSFDLPSPPLPSEVEDAALFDTVSALASASK